MNGDSMHRILCFSLLAAAALMATGTHAAAVPPDVIEQSTDLSPVGGGEARADVAAPGGGETDGDGTRAKLAAARARYVRVLSGAPERVKSLQESAADNARELGRLVKELSHPLPRVQPGRERAVSPGVSPSPPQAVTPSAPARTSPPAASGAAPTAAATVRVARVHALRDGLLREARAWKRAASGLEPDAVITLDGPAAARLRRLESALDINPPQEATR
jgi:hypothetical protein